MKYIYLTQGKLTLVDDEDYEELNKHKWYARKRLRDDFYYALRNSKRGDGKRSSILMHRVITRAEKGQEVDHINHDGLDNRRVNLRICNRYENCRNSSICYNTTSGYKGVSWHKGAKKWTAQIFFNKSLHHLGCFFCIIKAAKAYDEAARKHYGEFACLNFE